LKNIGGKIYIYEAKNINIGDFVGRGGAVNYELGFKLLDHNLVWGGGAIVQVNKRLNYRRVSLETPTTVR